MRSSEGWRVLVKCLLCCAALLWLSMTHAQTTYVRDANGRVVAVTQSNGTSVQYSYDTLGHVGPISAPLSAGQLAIFTLLPNHGVAGTQITISGQGFSPSASSDAVSFNGTPATVLTASNTQLTVAVPTGATTGPISVTVGSVTVISATPFTIDDTGEPPTISAVSPSIVAVGGSLTLTGAHLDPVAGQTVMSLGDRDISAVSSISDTQIQHTVTASDTSGYVTVETPYGQAVSASPIIVLPSGDTAANFTSTGFAVNGGSINLNIAAAGQTGAMLFNANAGDWISLQLSAITTTASTINYSIYAPGNQLIQQGTVSSSSPSIHLPKLLTSGAYLAVFTPNTAGAQLTIGYERAGELTESMPATVVTTTPGESKRLIFHATAGQTLTLAINGTTTNPVGQTVNYTIYSAGQESLTSGSTASNGAINLPALSNPGTYQIVIAPGGGVTGSVQLDLVPGIQDVLAPNGQLGSYNGYVAGQNINITFTASQSGNYELTFSGVTITGSTSSSLMMNVYNSNGVNVASNSDCYANWTCRFPLWNLPPGTYTVVVSPPDSNSSVGFNGMLEPDTLGSALSDNTAATVTLGLGQVERLTFTANAGDNVALKVSGESTSNPSGLPVYVNVYAPTTGPITTGNYYTTASVLGSGTIDMLGLPTSGTYTVVVSTSGVPGTAQLMVSPIVPQSIAANGTNQPYTASGAGQNVFMSFTANQGDNLELTLNGVSGIGSSSLTVNVYDSNGNNVASGAGCESNWTCRYPLWNLAAGTYVVEVSPPSSSDTLGFDALLEPDMVGPALSAGVPTTVTLGLGQVERVTFNANAGSNMALNLSGANTSNPSGLPVYVNVYSPASSSITTTNYYTTFNVNGSTGINLQDLPVTGTYTAVVYTSGVPGTAQLTATPTTASAITRNGANTRYAASVPGQNVYLTFNANQGDNLELTLNAVSGISGSLTMNVFDANGTNVASGGECYSGWTCRYSLWDLAAGTYTVVVSPPSASQTVGFYAILETDINGPVLSPNTPTTVNLSLGQVERLTFNANAGDSVNLNLSGVSTTNPSGLSAYVSVYRPDVGTITTGDAYSSFSTTSSSSLSLQNLPVSGTYTVVVSTSGIVGSSILELVPQ